MESFLQDPALLQEFLTESEELLDRVDQDLVKLESAPSDQELLNRVFRALHTIKGTAGFLGFEPIVRVGHRAEDVLTNLRHGQLKLNRRIMDALLRARDQLGKMLADLRGGGLKQYSLEPLLTELESVQTGGECDKPSPTAETSAASPHPDSNASAPDAHCGLTPATSSADPPLAQHAGNATAESRPAAAAQTMRVDVRKLDELVNLIGELVLERNRLLQLSRDICAGHSDGRGADSPLGHSAARLSFITEELQAAGLRTRMVAIDAVFSKFPRLVRDLAHSLQKEVALVVRGEDTEIDKTMVELIHDPLVHLVRNALDHGLEFPQEREQRGKPRCGTICLQARQEGDHILVSIVDDGAGMDPDRILRKAVEKRLIGAERASHLSKKEILDFIFLPGFSTVENPTDISGRGVGMDVVRSNLKKINGTIEVESTAGQGTAVRLRLPLTLAILPVLLVEVGEEVYALPLRSICETSRFAPASVHEVEGREVVCLRDESLPLVRLQWLFRSAAAENSDDEKKIVIMSVGGTRVALLVEQPGGPGINGGETAFLSQRLPRYRRGHGRWRRPGAAGARSRWAAGVGR